MGGAVDGVQLFGAFVQVLDRGVGDQADADRSAFHGFAKWLSFGHDGILAGNDPDHLEKIVKFNELLANCAIYSTTLDITAAANDLIAAGREIDPEDLATITPYITSKIRRFGDWKLDLTPPPPAVAGGLDLARMD
ncbi:hypothetical protein GCM10009789_36220 [Kribbella sancticallisti]|uniref:Tn3 transposase DDE domain-containing protein n=1 Tax=Kribbella sancticallisti TaxID=460087 RepID=A0ABP4PER0_9ACTN